MSITREEYERRRASCGADQQKILDRIVYDATEEEMRGRYVGRHTATIGGMVVDVGGTHYSMLPCRCGIKDGYLIVRPCPPHAELHAFLRAYDLETFEWRWKEVEDKYPKEVAQWRAEVAEQVKNTARYEAERAAEAAAWDGVISKRDTNV